MKEVFSYLEDVCIYGDETLVNNISVTILEILGNYKRGINVITENKLMCKINSALDIVDTDYKTMVSEKINDIIGKLKIKRNCLIYYTPTFDINNEEIFSRYVHNDVGFEASQNEINLNIELDKENICKSEALYFFSLFNKCLKKKHNELMFCSIMSLDNVNNWVFRFHIYRGMDNMWIDKNIDNYQEPIMYEIF